MFWERRSDIAGQPFTLRGYMVNQKHTRIFIRIAAALVLVPLLCGITSCSMLKDILNGKEPGNSSTATNDPFGRDPDASYESLEPTGSYTSEAFDNKAADADLLKVFWFIQSGMMWLAAIPLIMTRSLRKRRLLLRGSSIFRNL